MSLKIEKFKPFNLGTVSQNIENENNLNYDFKYEKAFLSKWFEFKIKIKNNNEEDVWFFRTSNFFKILLDALYLKKQLNWLKQTNGKKFELNKEVLMEYLGLEKLIELKKELDEKFVEIKNKNLYLKINLLEKLQETSQNLTVYLNSIPSFNLEKYYQDQDNKKQTQNQKIENIALEAHGFVVMQIIHLFK